MLEIGRLELTNPRILNETAPVWSRRPEKPGVLDDDGKIRDLSGVIPDVGGDALLPESLARLAQIDPATLPRGRWHAADRPLRRRRRQVHLRRPELLRPRRRVRHAGADRADHLHEGDLVASSGPNDDVEIPRGSEKTDWEVELGVVIGKTAKYVSEADAMAHVAGFCVVNDVSERAFQLEGTGQWVKGKSADTFGPIGPWLVTRGRGAGLPGARTCGSRSTASAIRTARPGRWCSACRILVSYLSRFMSLQPGDIISTGTPPGVGHGHEAAGLPARRQRGAARRRRPRRAAAASGRGDSCQLAPA